MGIAGLEGLPVMKDRIIQLTQQCYLEVATLIPSVFSIIYGRGGPVLDIMTPSRILTYNDSKCFQYQQHNTQKQQL